MSARQPFVPSRPASRSAAMRIAEEVSSTNVAEAFMIDPQNPLHQLQVGQVAKPASGLSSLINKSLNLSGFAKNTATSQSPSAQSLSQAPNKFLGSNNSDRAAQAHLVSNAQSRGHSNLNQTKILAPTPSLAFRSKTPAISSIEDFAFKTPALPSNLNRYTPAPDDGRKTARPLTPEPNSQIFMSSTFQPDSRAIEESSYLSSVDLPKSRLLAFARSSSVENLCGGLEGNENPDPPGFGNNTPRAHEGGPLRVPANSRLHASSDPRRDMAGDARGGYAYDEQDTNAIGGSKEMPTQQKRGRSEGYDDSLDDDAYISRVKRHKNHPEGMDQFNGPGQPSEPVQVTTPGHRSQPTSPLSDHPVYGQSLAHSPTAHLSVAAHDLLPRPPNRNGSAPFFDPTSTHPSSQPRSWPQHDQHQPFDAPEPFSQERYDRVSVSESAFNKILGEDVESYVAEQIDVYENLQKKWEDATVEEWVAGADELAESFVKVLDFVKDHMTTKIKVYAKLDQRLGAHSQILADREETLTRAKEDLVKSGGTLLTGSAG